MSNTKTKNKPTPHPHAHWIKLWADGVPIEYKAGTGQWVDVIQFSTMTMPDVEYRIKPSDKPWKPKEGEEYYYIHLDAYGRVLPRAYLWTDCESDNKFWEFGNCFRSKEEAEAAIPRVEVALKGGDSLMSKKSCLLELEVKDAEIKTLKEQVEAAKKRVEAARKSGKLKALDAYIKKYLEEIGHRISNQTVVDGEPLSNGEIALVRALRKTWGFAEIIKPGDAVVVSKNKNGVYKSTTHNISILLIDGEGSDAEIVEALELINKEHKIDNERALRDLDIKAGQILRDVTK